jgi:hypothetical protein
MVEIGAFFLRTDTELILKMRVSVHRGHSDRSIVDTGIG